MRWPVARRLILLVAPLLCHSAHGAPPKADPPAPAVAVTREKVDTLVAKLIEQLWSGLNADGHWDATKKHANVDSDENRNYGGESALALLALKVAGQDPQDARFQKALKFVVSQDTPGTYFRGLRATLLGHLCRTDDKHKKQLLEDGKFLLTGIGGVSGMYAYVPPKPEHQTIMSNGDYSNTQYGLLGLWAASDHGFETPMKFWQIIESGYFKGLTPDGGWGYLQNAREPYGSMTAAALASLFVIWEKAYIDIDSSCRGKPKPELIKAIDGGLKWMADNFAAYNTPKKGYDTTYHYYLYSLERVGVASGLKHFGRHDWYRECAAAILSGTRNPASTHTRAWTLLFLTYGRAPVAYNKLKYGKGGEWNDRPRDLAGLSKYLLKIYEKPYNWQVMPIESDPNEFHDAPVLMVSGKAAIAFSPAEVEKIRTYLLRGGTLFGQSLENSGAFVGSFKALCLKMFPGLEMTRLGVDHPIYSAFMKQTVAQPELWGLSDGVRTIALLTPKEISCDWQRLAMASGKQSFELGNNILQYAADRSGMWSKEETYWPIDAGKKPATTITIGRVSYGEAKAEHVWNPTGGTGWTRMDILSRNRGGPGIATVITDLSKPVDAKAVPMLHLTGVGSPVLGDEAKKNLKAYVEAGGFLLADAAGGKTLFADSFAKLAGEVFGPTALANVEPAASPFAAALTDGKLWYRHWKGMPRALRPLEAAGVRVGNRLGVLFLPYDLTYAMVGSPAFDPVGLEPSAADKIIPALLAWLTNGPPPTTAVDAK